MEKKPIGQFIATLRKSNGLTQQELANRLNVSNKTISKWERSESYPEITLIPVIAEIFNVTSDEILKGEQIKGNNNSARETTNNNENTKQIIQNYLVKFKNISFIALSLIVIGIILEFTISYSFFKTGIGFGTFLIFVAIAIILEVIHLNNSTLIIKNNAINTTDNPMISIFSEKTKMYSFIVFISSCISLIFSLPLILVKDDYFTNSVITAESYISLIPMLLVCSTAVFVIGYSIAIKKNGSLLPINQFPSPFREKMNKFSKLQFILFIPALLSPFILMSTNPSIDIRSYAAMVFTLPFIFAIIIHIFYIIKNPGNRLMVLIIGIRNLIYAYSSFFILILAYASITSLTNAKINYGFNPSHLIILVIISPLVTILYINAKKKITIKTII